MGRFAMRPDALERMARALAKVKERLVRSTTALEAAGVPYSVAGGHAVAAWVAQVEAGAVRNTRDVGIVIDRQDLPAAISAMAKAGFEYAEVTGNHIFFDGSDSEIDVSDSEIDVSDNNLSAVVYLLFAGEKVNPEHLTTVPEVSDSVTLSSFRVVSLEALLRMKLDSNRDEDRMHIYDLIHAGLVDDSWPDRFPPALADRLRQLLANPNG